MSQSMESSIAAREQILMRRASAYSLPLLAGQLWCDSASVTLAFAEAYQIGAPSNLCMSSQGDY
jgi:hypothetical protein